MDYKKITIDYIEGRIEPAVYETLVEEDSQLYEWIQSILPPGKTYSDWDFEKKQLVYFPFDIRIFMIMHERIDFGGPKGSLGYHCYIHEMITKIVSEAFPEIELNVDRKPQVLNNLRICACPDYIGGKEVSENNILGKLLSDIPMEWSESKQQKVARERIKEAFHIQGRKRPYWIQSPEWPVCNGNPMIYNKTVRINREYVQHYFYDEESGEERIVDDFF